MVDSLNPKEFGTEFQLNSLLNLKYKSLTTGQEEYCLTEDARNNIKFYHSAIWGGCDAVAYKGKIIYMSGNPIRPNQTYAIIIQDLIDNGKQSIYWDQTNIDMYFDL